MLGLTNLVWPNILNTKILHLLTGYGITHDRISHVSTRYKTQPLSYWPEQQQKYVYRGKFVDKSNLEAESPRRGTSIPGDSAGLPPLSFGVIQFYPSFVPGLWTLDS